MPEGGSDFNWFTMRFDDDKIEEQYLAECFHSHYVSHQCIHFQSLLVFLLPVPTAEMSFASKLWMATKLVAGLVFAAWLRHMLHRMESQTRARRLGKWLTLSTACLCFVAEALFRRKSLTVFLATLRWLQLAIFGLWVHTWTLSIGERLCLNVIIILCNLIEPPDQGMTKAEDVLVLIAVLIVSFLTSLVLESSQRISYRDRRMLLAHAQTERLGDSQLNHVIKNK